MQFGSSLGLTGPYRPNGQKFVVCALVLAGLLCFHLLFKQNGDSSPLFASIGKTADKWSTEISESRPLSKVTSKLQDWPWGNFHGGEDSSNPKWYNSFNPDVLYGKPPFDTPANEDIRPPKEAKQQQQAESKTYTLTTFKEAWLKNETGGPPTSTNLAPISTLCKSVSWHDDIVLDIASYNGGIGDLRVLILDFILFAMQTGSHIILPFYINGTLETSMWLDESTGLPFSQMFDVEFLISTLAEACPQMRVFRWTERAEIEAVVTESFDVGPFRMVQILDSGPPVMATIFKDWIATGPDGYQEDAMSLVTVELPLFSYDMRTKPKMRVALGRLLKFNSEIRKVAATALFKLRQNRHLETAIDPLKKIYQDAYYGVSLHTDIDEGSEWGFYEAQRRAHLDMCKELNLTLIYVATDRRQDTEQLRSEARQMGISVISKVDLLSKIEKQSDPDTLAFESLSIAQKNALDFEILSRSSFYSGPADNSFTWNLALRRAFYGEDERLGKSNASGVAKVYPSVIYDDGLSQIKSRGYSAREPHPVELYAPRSMYP